MHLYVLNIAHDFTLVFSYKVALMKTQMYNSLSVPLVQLSVL
jgi:hypothetical protein